MERTSKQPKGLRLIFMTELWERFAFYTLQTILILFMSEGLNLSDSSAYLLFGAYSALLYLTPIIGGYIADKYLGFQKTIIIGGWLFVIGYFLLSIPNHHVFFLGLSFNIVANGLFKPNVTSVLGEVYEGPDDHRRDPGFILLYLGMNLGALFPPLFLGAVVLWWGWSAGFLSAAVGMIISMLVFHRGRHLLHHAGRIPPESLLHQPHKKKRFYFWFFSATLVSIALIDVLFFFAAEVDFIVVLLSLLFLLAMIYFLMKENKPSRLRMGAALILTVISAGFWIFYSQQSTALVLFAKRNMSKNFLGLPFDAEGILFFNPFFIIILCPLFSKLWTALSRKKRDWTTPTKFAWGVFFMALGFLILALSTRYFSFEAFISPWWLFISLGFQSIGEIFLSPVGLAMITALSPHRYVGMMMGVWFLVQAAASAIGGKLATFATVLPEFTQEESLAVYSGAFTLFFWLCLVLALVAFICIPFLTRMIHLPSHKHVLPDIHTLSEKEEE